MPQSTESLIRAQAAGHTWERRSPRPEDEHLLGHTDNWLHALPMGVRPLHLQHDFPRIANELARLWAQPPALELYFEEKELGRREGRRGFPPLIKEELLAMHAYALRQRPAPQGPRSLQREARMT